MLCSASVYWAVGIGSRTAASATSYTFTEIGVGLTGTQVGAADVNNTGQVACMVGAAGSGHVNRYAGGTLTQLSSSVTVPYGINSSGQIVGYFYPPTYKSFYTDSGTNRNCIWR